MGGLSGRLRHRHAPVAGRESDLLGRSAVVPPDQKMVGSSVFTLLAKAGFGAKCEELKRKANRRADQPTAPQGASERPRRAAELDGVARPPAYEINGMEER